MSTLPTPEGLALARRHAALRARERARALRKARRLGLPAEIVYAVRIQMINWRAAWRAARILQTELSQEQ